MPAGAILKAWQAKTVIHGENLWHDHDKELI